MQDKTIETIGLYLQGILDSTKIEMENLKNEIGDTIVNSNAPSEKVYDLKEMYIKMIGERRLIDKLLRAFPELKKIK
jgi:hypothetical protein